MANPTLTGTTNKTDFAPGDTITGTWLAADPDNSSMTLRVQGHDDQGNLGQWDVTLRRIDNFTVERVYLVEPNVDLTFNQDARTFSGAMPTA